MTPITRARVLAAFTRVLAAAGDAVLVATLRRRVDPAFDPTDACVSEHPVSLVFLSTSPDAPVDPVRLPGDRRGLVLTADAPPPRPTDALVAEGQTWTVIEVAESSAALGLLFRVTVRPEAVL
ncbi:hypothetical protein [Pararhodospirillum photometricum]|uniref:Uncharacterized protein n=1 Tax=Pararhodospirillum photometricum DSM 122 TaxID=1150469 RepID=H6SRX4_PARPM|nr:hypothetical protein [Pararhodospirillum photometricum]CCG07653.1 Putative uncharacterized protein [Pararhodospirillum photometricum DSM 122]